MTTSGASEPNSTDEVSAQSVVEDEAETDESEIDEVRGDDPETDEAETDESEREVTPQSPELRRQQYAVGVGAAIISGFAVAIGSIQQYPSLPEYVPIIAGFLGAGLVYWIVKRSLYPTEAELAASD